MLHVRFGDRSARTVACWRLASIVVAILPNVSAVAQLSATVPAKPAESLRIATYNVSFHRNRAGELTENLIAGDRQAERIASVIRWIRPDVLLLNEVDFSSSPDNAALFSNQYLSRSQTDALGGAAWEMPYSFTAPVNTGIPSGMDLNNNQRQSDPEDSWGFGVYPGQYGMAVLSRFEIASQSARTFQNLLWSELPGALKPKAPNESQPYYSEATWRRLRLPSKSFWDVPVVTPLGELHILASHPTPPAFDGPEDRNGCRNHDEIRIIIEYIDGKHAEYFVDDRGTSGPLGKDKLFAILGDLNSDPADGGSRQTAIHDLLNHPRIFSFPAPRSEGAISSAASQQGANAKHKGDPATDTADFSDGSVGNLRADYVLPSQQLQVVASGVFWPSLDKVEPAIRKALQDAMSATDHHLVWVDVKRK